MQIRELHIDGFGLFAQAAVRGFQPGINVVYGPNEQGKTTMLEFIRRIMFGFPKRKGADVNAYPALRGGAYGGSLAGILKSGGEFTVARAAGPHGGKVAVTVNGRRQEGQEALDALLGNASPELFHNIYAFSLDELQVLGSLQSEAVRARIYGAGLGLGGASLMETERKIQSAADGIFSPRGRSHRMAELLGHVRTLQAEIQDIRRSLGQYDELKEQEARLLREEDALRARRAEAEERRRALEAQRDLYAVSRELSALEEEMSALPDGAELPENAHGALGALQAEIKSLRDRIMAEEGRERALALEQDALVVNEGLLRQAASVISLRGMAGQILPGMREEEVLREKAELLDERIQAEIKKIGRGWNVDAVANFPITEAERQNLRDCRERLNEARQSVLRAREKIDDYQEQKARGGGVGSPLPGWLQAVNLSLVGLGILGVLVALWQWNWTAFTLALAALGIGLSGARMAWKTSAERVREDPFLAVLGERLRKAELEEKDQHAHLRAWLRAKNFDEYLTPASAESILTLIDTVRGLLAQAADLEQRRRRIREVEGAAAALIESLRPLLRDLHLSRDLPANIEGIERAWQAAEKAEEKKKVLRLQSGVAMEQLAAWRRQLAEKEQEVDQYVRACGADGVADFERRSRLAEKKAELARLAREKRAILQSRVGGGEAYARLRAAVQDASLEDIRLELAAVTEQLEEAQKCRDGLLEETGKLRDKLEALAGNTAFVRKSGELEAQKERLNACAREWAAYKIALLMLRRAKEKYEKERQPAVIRGAEKYFSRITGGKYQRIFKPLDADDIQADDGAGRCKGATEMSRGAREQLYLAMRLGLIEEYETRAEPLPVVMDDVLVNFDDARMARVLDILRDFAQPRQVIILSCHQRSLEMYLQAGATRVLF